jgi:hypothetical protein
MSLGLYILEGHEVRQVDDDILEWGRWLEAHKDECRVAFDTIYDVGVSTVFLGSDRRLSGDGPPLLFETTVFGGPLDGYTDRYSTWEEAEAGHKAIVEHVKYPPIEVLKNDHGDL